MQPSLEAAEETPPRPAGKRVSLRAGREVGERMAAVGMVFHTGVPGQPRYVR